MVGADPSLRHLIFVARRPQTRRARRMLAAALPADVTFTVQASRYDTIRPDHWWRDT
jgi:hypothetical protein